MSADNGVMMQYFHWYTPADGSLWKQLAENAKNLAEAGITAVWLPPFYKGAAGGFDVGYGVYDLFDLGNSTRKGPSVQNMVRARRVGLQGKLSMEWSGTLPLKTKNRCIGFNTSSLG